MQDLPTEILLHIFNYLDTKARLSCKAVCQRWNILIGTASDFKYERNLILNENFDPTIILQSSTIYYSLTIQALNAKLHKLEPTWTKLATTVEKLLFSKSNFETLEYCMLNDVFSFPKTRHLSFQGIKCEFNLDLSKIANLHSLETLIINANAITEKRFVPSSSLSLDGYQDFFRNSPNLRVLHLHLDSMNNVEELYKTICSSLPCIEDLEIYSANWRSGINYQTILSDSPKKIRKLKLCNMVKFHDRTETSEARLMKLFKIYLDLVYVRINNITGLFNQENQEIVVEQYGVRMQNLRRP